MKKLQTQLSKSKTTAQTLLQQQQSLQKDISTKQSHIKSLEHQLHQLSINHSLENKSLDDTSVSTKQSTQVNILDDAASVNTKQSTKSTSSIKEAQTTKLIKELTQELTQELTDLTEENEALEHQFNKLSQQYQQLQAHSKQQIQSLKTTHEDTCAKLQSELDTLRTTHSKLTK